jgi:hypothetical protein
LFAIGAAQAGVQGQGAAGTGEQVGHAQHQWLTMLTVFKYVSRVRLQRKLVGRDRELHALVSMWGVCIWDEQASLQQPHWPGGKLNIELITGQPVTAW